jgi:uncharacterized membrane protein YfhO
MGNAWFVDSIVYVDNADQELAKMASIDLRRHAVADKQFQTALGSSPAEADSTAAIHLDSYEPNELHYTVNSQQGGIVVFSEIYYPGWTATIDGQDAEIGRVNYVLRAMNIAAGSHQVVLTFKPQTVKTTETVAYIALTILLLVLLAAIVLKKLKNKRKQ